MSDDLLWKSTRAIVLAIRVTLILGACALIVGFIASLAGNDRVFVQVEDDLRQHGFAIGGRPGLGITIAVAASMLALSERFLSRLNAILASLPGGDPFHIRNAGHLGVMAWLALAIQFLGSVMWLFPLEVLAIGSRIRLENDLSVAGAVLVLLLFILARVFRVGAKMRSELEGTV